MPSVWPPVSASSAWILYHRPEARLLNSAVECFCQLEIKDRLRIEGGCSHNRMLRAFSEPEALPEPDISGIMEVSLENALQRSSNQGSDQSDVDGLTEEVIA
jgi:hypothetical protein